MPAKTPVLICGANPLAASSRIAQPARSFSRSETTNAKTVNNRLNAYSGIGKYSAKPIDQMAIIPVIEWLIIYTPENANAATIAMVHIHQQALARARNHHNANPLATTNNSPSANQVNANGSGSDKCSALPSAALNWYS